MRKRRSVVVILVAAALLGGSTSLVHPNAPAPIARPDPAPAGARAAAAGRLFWDAFHGNQFDRVDAVIAELSAAYQETPYDATLAALLAAAHDWKFMERRRACLPAAPLRDHLGAAICLFDRSVRMDPSNRLRPGLLVAAQAVAAKLDGDGRALEAALDTMRRNTPVDPSVHGFVQGWVFSALLEADDSRYPEAATGFFTALDDCAGFRIPRLFPIVPRFAFSYLALRARHDFVCFDTDVAPHNLEGTLLGLGDVLLKAGKLWRARMVYEGVKRAPHYSTWPYRDRLEARLAEPERLRDKFRADTGKFDVAEPAMFFQSSFACTGCHAR
jgi:hypothetical protein